LKRIVSKKRKVFATFAAIIMAWAVYCKYIIVNGQAFMLFACSVDIGRALSEIADIVVLPGPDTF